MAARTSTAPTAATIAARRPVFLFAAGVCVTGASFGVCTESVMSPLP
jgi:hypothetical protein